MKWIRPKEGLAEAVDDPRGFGYDTAIDQDDYSFSHFKTDYMDNPSYKQEIDAFIAENTDEEWENRKVDELYLRPGEIAGAKYEDLRDEMIDSLDIVIPNVDGDQEPALDWIDDQIDRAAKTAGHSWANNFDERKVE